MGQIVNFLKGIVDFFVGVIQFVIKLVGDLVYVVKLLGETVAHLPDYLQFLPSAVVAILVTTLAVVVIYKVLGREG